MAEVYYLSKNFRIIGVELEKEMATHSSVLAWRIPGMGEPGGLPFMGSHRVGHDCSDLAAAAAGGGKAGQKNLLILFSRMNIRL